MSDKTANSDKAQEETTKEEKVQAPEDAVEQEGQADDKPVDETGSDEVSDNGSETETDSETAWSDTGEQDAAEELAAAEARAEDNWNQYLRAVAELENARKRAERDVQHAHKFALERFAGELLSVKDSLEMGLSAARDVTDKADALVEGTEMTLKQFEQVLDKFGIEEIDADGAEFDPEVHEAMAMQPSDEVRPDHVLAVVQKGYIINGRVLRPARVLVAKAPE